MVHFNHWCLRRIIQGYLISLRLLYCPSQVLCFLQTESKTLHQQKHYNLLYYDSHFITVARSKACTTSRVCL